MSAAARNQCAEIARAERIALQRENRDLVTRYITNCGEIERLRGIELAAGIAIEHPETHPGFTRNGNGNGHHAEPELDAPTWPGARG